MTVVVPIDCRFGGGSRRSCAERKAGPPFPIGGDHVAGGDEQPEQEEQCKCDGQDPTPMFKPADHAPHATQPNLRFDFAKLQSDAKPLELDRFRIQLPGTRKNDPRPVASEARFTATSEMN